MNRYNVEVRWGAGQNDWRFAQYAANDAYEAISRARYESPSATVVNVWPAGRPDEQTAWLKGDAT